MSSFAYSYKKRKAVKAILCRLKHCHTILFSSELTWGRGVGLGQTTEIHIEALVVSDNCVFSAYPALCLDTFLPFHVTAFQTKTETDQSCHHSSF